MQTEQLILDKTCILLIMDFKDSVDKQCESIDFSNSCRQFYMTRMKATEDFKKQVAESETSDFKRRTTIDNAMETLKKEMVRT